MVLEFVPSYFYEQPLPEILFFYRNRVFCL
ncbi:unnamed protein product, partial [Vitis vinifera]|uniref:Uncharacterized protein n=1 Tax=Vitis vinifera TaxID=29760 RepID=D7T0C3_VITVI